MSEDRILAVAKINAPQAFSADSVLGTVTNRSRAIERARTTVAYVEATIVTPSETHAAIVETLKAAAPGIAEITRDAIARSVCLKLRSKIAPGATFRPTHRHRARPGNYEIVSTGLLQTVKPIGDYCDVTIYKTEGGAYWVRPTEEFNQRFEALE